jgi:hypothetical protein
MDEAGIRLLDGRGGKRHRLPFAPTAKQRQLQALRQGIDAIQPVLSKFEKSLNDSQRTQLAMAIAG